MTHAIYFPGADLVSQWFGQGNYTMPSISKLLLHTTETTGWPGYDDGKKAPTLTIHPGKRLVRQHFPLNGSARALRDPSDTEVRENRDNIVQIEICWYAEKIHLLDDWTLRKIAEIAAFLNLEWELPLVAAPIWLPYPQSYGNTKARMTGPQFDAFKGILGHMHASGNDHGDPGDINITAILSHAAEMVSTVDPGGLNMTGQQEARLNWVYGAFIDSDGSPSVTTLLGRQQESLDAINETLQAILLKLGE